MTVYWNWKLTRDGAIRFGLMLMVFSIVYQNVAWLNSKFLPQLPVGYILLIYFGIFIIRHVYRVLKWYSVWFKYGTRQKLENFIVHLCIYFIVISVALSVPNLNMPRLAAAITATNESNKIPVFESEVPDLNSIITDSKDFDLIEKNETRITSSTLWINYNTYAIGGDGHIIKLKQNSSAKNPTYQEVLNFLQTDQTDKCNYVLDKFVCADFAEQVQNNAEIAGYNCAYVDISFTDNAGHACNAFNTTDRGLIFIDCTNSLEGGGPYNGDCIVNIVKGSIYKPQYLFNSGGWYNLPMGTVKSYTVYWD
ncbi:MULTISPECIES: hypothetical protein [Methanosarcina]|uniref:Uncharacterized protein n=3 Tax=Methanosarcina barkeri TaxID=2208 RepID=A0A0E3QUA0_METBA|nr:MULTISPECIES: hypothetical protein [Methanosarcina]AKB54927.1 hypothetical protein MSBRM_1929 [Methanosarcina barkeri MS]AKB56997.1 hypothetical protein MSBR2_0481 [Methanosarcina barkeri 227]AKJ37564.1 hypothetical protein MCM1_0458 [Methanosarcina barkeri CM1]OED10101.1 hypothetical protein A9239_00780 [Methanosarcina sp. A14]